MSYNEGRETRIEIEHDEFGIESWTADAMAELAGESFPIGERVPEAAGKAFDWAIWYEEWLNLLAYTSHCTLSPPKQLKLYAADQFEASIPWDQLKGAAVLFAEQDGTPLAKGGPIRLFVPNGSSKCLNVKNIVRIVVSTQEELSEEATYGFKQQFTLDDMTIKKRSTT
ncbi:molybdopterin-dependent oxidoreductase [Paenibacillus sp. MMS18-CY102]|uniref:molybdopterin-dependent oxidoreductase n=1 Tax=Paenibacillus sp. MMS18-CY102 TaxID=2682849 RepID=UPI001365CAF2|nr:molybdopterin-dependent oxidoreductase [Paenibacillus sp. MMS18-CY102]MWC26951.1 molybdopterin-dependent oxidoreductase [Paenibacillus sp. MMS18-CY102]